MSASTTTRCTTTQKKPHQYMSSAPCATIEKLSAALPIERSDCAILPPGTELSPASLRNEFTLSLITGLPRSEPHSTAGVIRQLSTTDGRQEDWTDLGLGKGGEGLRGCEGELLRLTCTSREIRSLTFDPCILQARQPLVVIATRMEHRFQGASPDTR